MTIDFTAFNDVPDDIYESVVELNSWLLDDEVHGTEPEEHRLCKYLRYRWCGDNAIGIDTLPLPRDMTLVETLSEIVQFTLQFPDQTKTLQEKTVAVIRSYICLSVLNAAGSWRIGGGANSMFEIINLADKLAALLQNLPYVQTAIENDELEDWDEFSDAGLYQKLKCAPLSCLKAIAATNPNLEHGLTAEQFTMTLVQIAKVITQRHRDNELYGRERDYAYAISTLGQQYFETVYNDAAAKKIIDSLTPETAQHLAMALYIWAANSFEAHALQTETPMGLYGSLVSNYGIKPPDSQTYNKDLRKAGFNFSQAISLAMALAEVLYKTIPVQDFTLQHMPATSDEQSHQARRGIIGLIGNAAASRTTGIEDEAHDTVVVPHDISSLLKPLKTPPRKGDPKLKLIEPPEVKPERHQRELIPAGT